MLGFGGRGGVIGPIFFHSISSSWVNLRLHTENPLYTLPGSSLKVCLVVGGWWWWVVLKVNLVIALALALAKPNNTEFHGGVHAEIYVVHAEIWWGGPRHYVDHSNSS